MKNNAFMYALGAVIAVGFFVLLYFIVFIEIPTSNKDIVNIVVGALVGAFAMVVSFFFGSSKGSMDKTEILSKDPK